MIYHASFDPAVPERAFEPGAGREAPDPLFLTYGPKTRREFLNLLAWKGWHPG